MKYLPIPHRNLHVLRICASLCIVIPSIGVANDAHKRVVAKYASDATIGGFGAIAHNDLARVLAESDANAAAVVE
jgi:hypothetical protein